MTKRYPASILVPGCKALFIDQNVPHTGTVDNIYENLITFKDVTFLDRVLDYEYKDRVKEDNIDRIFKVQYDPSQVYRTARIHLSKYPSVVEQLQVNAIMNTLKRNPKTGLIDVHDFLEVGPKYSLYSNQYTQSIFSPRISFDTEKTVIIFDDEVSDAEKTGKKIYRPVFVGWEGKNMANGYALFEYTSESSLYPSRYIIPKWKETSRNYTTRFPSDSDYIEELEKRYHIDRDDIEILGSDNDFNEDHIIQVLEYSPTIAYMNYRPNGNFANIGITNTWKIFGKDLVVHKMIFYNEVYRRKDS